MNWSAKKQSNKINPPRRDSLTLLELNNQKREVKIYQQNTQELSEKAAIKETELKLLEEKKLK